MKLIDKLPSFYKNYMVEAIQDSYDSELSSLKENIDDTINQMFVNTSTWGLDMWESILCIQNNEDLNYETRRSNIKAKMRSLGTTKLKVIKNICEAYTKTDVEVIVLSNEFIFILEFIVNNCSYNSIVELDKVLENVKPCHLEHKFKMILLNKNELFCGTAINTGETVTVYPWTPSNIEIFGEITISTGNDRSMEKVILYPKQEAI
ncbi:putative phage tail protein [Clostridioides difficile]|uniref:putative phage tail protein n=1 Tax=Clostridioides difficile TaxID=1496 RepID=UPI001C169500|nr:putative phage tail protein [Clostridioides difficile]MDK3209680.1 DUF2313 domain-containing protein [Clostridioides difficile]MDL0188066.1 DUF2313 domain-containing protein [Clostridioides difficile]MDL0191516.1 DUF2313 domain-containing protein [Clostridioides difficile]HBF2211487.1 DUF2313 domain-containing protein [Clostridioides difficile]HBG3700865.1 DUF2313 domain-containing protein [Clostridioides difficile]